MPYTPIRDIYSQAQQAAGAGLGLQRQRQAIQAQDFNMSKARAEWDEEMRQQAMKKEMQALWQQSGGDLEKFKEAGGYRYLSPDQVRLIEEQFSAQKEKQEKKDLLQRRMGAAKDLAGALAFDESMTSEGPTVENAYNLGRKQTEYGAMAEADPDTFLSEYIKKRFGKDSPSGKWQYWQNETGIYAADPSAPNEVLTLKEFPKGEKKGPSSYIERVRDLVVGFENRLSAGETLSADEMREYKENRAIYDRHLKGAPPSSAKEDAFIGEIDELLANSTTPPEVKERLKATKQDILAARAKRGLIVATGVDPATGQQTTNLFRAQPTGAGGGVSALGGTTLGPKAAEKPLPGSIQDNIDGFMQTWTLLGEMEEGLSESGIAKGWISKVEAKIGRNEKAMKFQNAYDAIRPAVQSMIKGIPSNFDVQTFIASLPDLTRPENVNKEKIRIVKEQVRRMVKNVIGYYKGTGYNVPDNVVQFAQDIGVDVNNVRSWDGTTDPITGESLGNDTPKPVQAPNPRAGGVKVY